jgi:aryl-alcohol dehydrogenase-like predicted oxidoreductase
MHPLCLDLGVGVIPWSPLARGKLTRDPDAATTRSGTDRVLTRLYTGTEDSDRAVARAVASVAEARGVPRAQVALAWVAQQSAVSAPIIGATQLAHLDDAVAALDLTLSDAELDALQAPYVTREPAGF